MRGTTAHETIAVSLEDSDGARSRRDFLRAARSVALTGSAAGLGLLGTRTARAAPNVVHRPISDFVDAQGTTVTFVPPVGDFIGWTSLEGLGASVDYAGVSDRYLEDLLGERRLGTTTRGGITECLLDDGNALVTVILHTTNALTYVIPLPPRVPRVAFPWRDNPLLFGHRTPEVAEGAEPALAESHLQLVFKGVPGGPMPDLTRDLGAPPLIPMVPIDLISINFRANATGPLRAGLTDVPWSEGTPGRCIVSQTGILSRTHWMGATADGFPAELVALRVIGR